MPPNALPPNPPSVRYLIEYMGFLVVAGVMTMLPLPAASAFGGWIFRQIGPRGRKHHPRMLDNIARAFPALSEPARQDMARRVWDNMGRVLGEFFHLQEILRERIVCENPQVLTRLAASGAGSVVCGGHQANWEVTAGLLVGAGLKPMGVYHPMSNPFVDAYVKRRRAPLYPGGLLPKRAASTPHQILRHARNRQTVAFLVDQFLVNGLEVPFFGRPAPSTGFPAMVARAQNLPLVLVHMRREPGVRFVATCEEIEVPRTADKDADVLAATAAIQAALERSIRRQPAQWLWSHRRWGWG